MIDREGGTFMSSDRVEVKSGAQILDLSVEEFRRRVIDGQIQPETFIRSPLTDYRWRHAADTGLYLSTLEQSEFQVVDRRGPSHSFVEGGAVAGVRRASSIPALLLLAGLAALAVYWFFW